MQITEIPFVARVGIRRQKDGRLMLSPTTEATNHLGTLHAGVQFLLAETASGDHLQQAFPAMADGVVPVLRSSTLKFKRPAQGTIVAFPATTEEGRSAFLAQFERRGRAVISVDVDVRDGTGNLTCQGTFEWFVQRLAVPGQG